MKKSYRLAQERIYADALKGVRVAVTKITAHRDASATVKANENQVKAIRRLEGVEILAEGKHGITFRIPAAVEYHSKNAPLMTEDEKAAIEAQKQARREARDAERQQEDEGEPEESDEDEPEGE